MAVSGPARPEACAKCIGRDGHGTAILSSLVIDLADFQRKKFFRGSCRVILRSKVAGTGGLPPRWGMDSSACRGGTFWLMLSRIVSTIPMIRSLTRSPMSCIRATGEYAVSPGTFGPGVVLKMFWTQWSVAGMPSGRESHRVSSPTIVSLRFAVAIGTGLTRSFWLMSLRSLRPRLAA